MSADSSHKMTTSSCSYTRPARAPSSSASYSPSSFCSDTLEATVDEIRSAKGWVGRMATRHKEVAHLYHQDDVAETQDVQVASECLVQPFAHNNNAIAAVNVSSANTHDTSALTCSFGSHTNREHIYPIALEETTPDLPHTRHSRYSWCQLTATPELAMQMIAHTATLLYMVLVCLHLRHSMDNPFVWHPILMSIMLVLTTEATIILHRTTSSISSQPTARRLRQSCGFVHPQTIHSFVQAAAAVVCVTGIVQCLTRRDALNPQLASRSHRVAGVLSMCLFFVQIFFRLYMALVSYRSGKSYRNASKRWHKYHRCLGYLTLIALWTSAWFGIHSAWMQSLGENGNSEGVLYRHKDFCWFVVFASLILGVFVPADLRKLGLR